MVKAPRRNIGLPFGQQNTRLLFIAGTMFFFWALYDGTISYIAPLIVTEHGFSDAAMGILIGSSSVFGGLFDFLVGRYLTDPHWKRVFLIMFAACVATAFSFWKASGLWTFILAMALWGLYFNFSNYGMFDFVSVNASESERGKEYGVINIFRFLGYIVAPTVLGFLIISTVTTASFEFLSFGIAIAFIFYLFLSRASDSSATKTHALDKPRMSVGLHSVFRDGWLLLPVLSFIVLYNIIESFFWTIGPLLSVQFQDLHPWEGLFVTAYFMPMLLSGWFVGNMTNRLGKKRTAMISLGIGSAILILFFATQDPYALIALIFVASLFVTFSLPSINAAFADYISEDRRDESRIEAMSDFSSNVGYVVGPAIAGILAGTVGNIDAFGVLGVGSLAAVLLLLYVTPRHINLVRGAARSR